MMIFLILAGGLLVSLLLALTVGRAMSEQPCEMTDERLQEESYWEAASGHFPNRYSREIDRRKA